MSCRWTFVLHVAPRRSAGRHSKLKIDSNHTTSFTITGFHTPSLYVLPLHADAGANGRHFLTFPNANDEQCFQTSSLSLFSRYLTECLPSASPPLPPFAPSPPSPLSLSPPHRSPFSPQAQVCRVRVRARVRRSSGQGLRYGCHGERLQPLRLRKRRCRRQVSRYPDARRAPTPFLPPFCFLSLS